MKLDTYMTIVPGTIIRAHDFNSKAFYVEGVIDGYYVNQDGIPYFCVEVSEDSTGEQRESELVPINLGDLEWPDRIIELGVEDELLDD